jgi:beta-propeller repeat-containing protein
LQGKSLPGRMFQGLLLTAMLVAPALLAAMPAGAASVTMARTIGGVQNDYAYTVITDAAGYMYLTGMTRSPAFPVVAALQPTYAGSGTLIGSTAGDAIVVKLAPDGSTVWATFLGGSGGDGGLGIALDAAGNVFVSGTTSSTNFPTTPGSARPTYGGGESELFVAKIKGDGSALLYATYLGGSGREIIAGLAVDAAGNAYVGGDTTSSNYPVVNGADMSYNGGFNDAMLTKLSPDGSTILGSTFLGGFDGDEVDNLGLDAAGNVLATGWTLSSNFPTKNAYDASFNGGSFPGDAWVAKLPANLSTTTFSTFLGGSGGDGGTRIVGDAAGDIHVIGHTASTNFPLLRPVQAAKSGGTDGFAATLSGDGSTLKYGSFLGGSADENVWGLAFDEARQLTLVTGWTSSSASFPRANALQSAGAGGSDVFIAQIDEAAGALRFSTLLGGSGEDAVFWPTLAPNGDPLLPAWTNSPDFPAPGFARIGGDDIVLLRLSVPLPSIQLTLAGSTGDGGWVRGPATLGFACVAPSPTNLTYRIGAGATVPYVAPFSLSVDGVYQVHATCTDAPGNRGDADHTIRIDATTPATTATSSGNTGNNGWFRSPVHVAFACADATSGCAGTLAESVDSLEPCCNFNPGAADVTADGIHTLRFRSRDVAGNDEADQFVTLKVDATVPVTTAEPVGIAGNNGWYRSPVAVSVGCSDLTSGCAQRFAGVDDSAEPVGDTLDIAADGVHTLRFFSEDVAGNRDGEATSLVRIDATPPVATAEPVGLVGHAGWYRSPVMVSMGCDDLTSGCAQRFAGVGDTAEPVGDTLDVAADGVYTLRFGAEDVAGNLQEEQQASLRIDATPPITTAEPVGLVGNAGWYRSPVAVSVGCSDLTSGCAQRFGGIGDSAEPVGDTLDIATDGVHAVHFYSEDVAGNADTPLDALIRIDATPPVATAEPVGLVGNAGWYRSPVIVSMGCDDLTSGCAQRFAGVGDTAEPVGDTLDIAADGVYTLRFGAEDVAGNPLEEQQVPLRIDATPPVTTAEPVGLVGKAGWYRSLVTVNVGCSDLTSGCAQSFAGEANGAEPIGAALDIAADGVHAVHFYSEDVAGNADTPLDALIRIDATPPVATAEPVGLVGNDGWYRSAVTVNLVCTDATSGCAANLASLGDAAEPVGGAVDIASDGVYALRFAAEDVAGNVAVEQVAPLSIDATPPVTSLEPSGLAGANGWWRSAVMVDLACADATSGCAVTRGALDGAPATSAGAVALEGDGTHTLNVASEDVAGNVEPETTLELRIDTVAPEVAIAAPEPGTIYAYGVRVAPADACARLSPRMCDALQLGTLPLPLLIGTNEVLVAATDATAGMDRAELWMDGALVASDSAAPYALPLDVSASALGEHGLEVRGFDAAGNSASATITVFTVPTSLEGIVATAGL